MSLLELQGVAFITGAASGIGRGTALGFAKHGIRQLALADVNEAELRATAAEVEAIFAASAPAPAPGSGPGSTNTSTAPSACLTLVVDVSSEASVQTAIDAVVARFGRLDVAVNNAGIAGPKGPAPDIDYEAWRACFDVNVHGVWLCQRAEIAQMLKQDVTDPRRGRGVIINTASMLGLIGSWYTPTATAYVAGKHAVVGLTRTDSMAYAKEGIRINAMCPGYVETNFIQKALKAGLFDEEFKKIPMGRPAQIEEIVDSMMFLASPMSSYMTGATLVVDGGFTAA